MAENDTLKTNLASQSGATTTTTPTQASSLPTGNSTLDTYNSGRESQIRNVYDMAKQNTLNQLQTAYDQNLSNAEANREKINPQYQDSMNQLSAEYERQRRNNNMQANANGLNTGAGSQMALAQMNTYNQGQAGLEKQKNEALDTADKGILDLKTNYQNQISQAVSNNDYQLAAALLDEYGEQYERQMTQAQQLASYGDFSLYSQIYGADAAQAMEKSWLLQNPSLAYTLGKITADEYFKMTGKHPPDVAEQLAQQAAALKSYGGGYYPNSSGGTNAETVTYGRGKSGYDTTPINIDYGATQNSAFWDTLRDRGGSTAPNGNAILPTSTNFKQVNATKGTTK